MGKPIFQRTKPKMDLGASPSGTALSAVSPQASPSEDAATIAGSPAHEQPPTMRQSIEPTYDSRTDGHQFTITTCLNDRPIKFEDPIPDPFVYNTTRIHWWD